jgi:RNase P subunit RPR2
MQTLDYRTFCEDCRELTYHEIRYKSEPEFVGRVLVCPNCGQQIFQPIGLGTSSQDC